MFDKLIAGLKSELHKPLPGEEAQFLMAPLQRKKTAFSDIENAKVASVLILLYPHLDSAYVPFILRTSYEGTHGGQVSFPGGKSDTDDLTLENTALRESKEEIGIIAENTVIIAKLTSLYIPPSNFLVHPFLAYSEKRPDFKIDKSEVEKLLEVDISELLDESNKKMKQITHRATGTLMDTPYLDIQNETIWGATAMMISELNAIIRNALK